MLDPILEKFGDHGAESSRRDKYQDHYAAYWCIKMLSDSTISAVICEYGEDLVIEKADKYELHQVKTKQESVGMWEIKELIPVIGKNFAMVPYFGPVSKCCFVSNQGAKGVLHNLKKVINQDHLNWSSEDKSIFDDFCKNHAQSILNEVQRVDPTNKDTKDEIEKRLLLLEISTDFHHMEYIQDTSLRNLRQIVEEQQRNTVVIPYTDREIATIYENLMGIVGKATIGRTRLEKTIRKTQVEECLSIPLNRRLQYRLPTQSEIEDAPGKTILIKKLGLGGFPPSFNDHAIEVRHTVALQCRQWNFGQTVTLLDDIRFRVKHACINCYYNACLAEPSTVDLGRLVWEEVRTELQVLVDYYQKIQVPFVDMIFLEGIVFVLTSECHLYWSQHEIQ